VGVQDHSPTLGILKRNVEHQNAVLHNTQLESSRMIQNAEINDAITKLYNKVDTYSAEDRWCFDLPLAL
jgi:hypothetical protein